MSCSKLVMVEEELQKNKVCYQEERGDRYKVRNFVPFDICASPPELISSTIFFFLFLLFVYSYGAAFS